MPASGSARAPSGLRRRSPATAAFSAHVDPAPGRVRGRLSDLRVRGTGEALIPVSSKRVDNRIPASVPAAIPAIAWASVSSNIWVAASVNEHQQVAIAHLRHPPVQLREVRRAMDEGSDHVALGPGRATGMAGVQSSRGISTFLRGQEPPRQEPMRHGHIRSLPGAGGLSRVSLRFHLSKASLVFSPACLRLLLV